MAAKSRQCSTCPKMIRADNISGQCIVCKVGGVTTSSKPEDQVAQDQEKRRANTVITGLKAKYDEALKTIDRQQEELGLVTALKSNVDIFNIEPRFGKGTGEATAVALFSDVHGEELVGKEVGGLNLYNPTISHKRVTTFFQGLLRLIKMFQQDVKIESLVLALLGDYITGQIHGADNAETNAMQPMYAVITARNQIISGIEFLLNNSTLNLVIPCHSGNHARTTLKTRFASENGHSLEYLMYVTLADHFRNEPRVTFIIPEGMHSYVKVYDTTIRFQHGHAIKYGGGVGGIYIPVNKAIAQWNKGRHADLDVFGHFHQLRDGGNFLCNGSVIGYNSFALSIKADYEPPQQAMFLVNKKYGRQGHWPIYL